MGLTELTLHHRVSGCAGRQRNLLFRCGSRLAQLLLSLGSASQVPWISSQALCIHRLEEACVLLQGIKKVVGRTVTHSWLHVAV